MIEIVDIETGEVHSLECISKTGSDIAADIIGSYYELTEDGRFVMPINEINFWKDALPRLAQIDELAESLADQYGWDAVEDVLSRVDDRADSDLPAWIELAEQALRELEGSEP